jgi:hypothetical protein
LPVATAAEPRDAAGAEAVGAELGPAAVGTRRRGAGSFVAGAG